MTPSEFKAWFDGFTEAFNGCPTKAQWARIKARVAEIDGSPITERVYIDRYVRPYPYWQYLGIGMCGVAQNAADFPGSNDVSPHYSLTAGVGRFDSSQAMAELGRMEATSLAAG